MLSSPELFIVMGVVLMILELVLGGIANFDLFLLGTCFVFGGLVGTVMDSQLVAMLISFFMAIFYLITIRPFLQRFILPKHNPSNVDSLIGKIAKVVRPITAAEPGQVKLASGDLWIARSTIPQVSGIEVKVMRVEGNSLWVEKVKKI